MFQPVICHSTNARCQPLLERNIFGVIRAPKIQRPGNYPHHKTNSYAVFLESTASGPTDTQSSALACAAWSGVSFATAPDSKSSATAAVALSRATRLKYVQSLI
jgi:hypothetical protein